MDIDLKKETFIGPKEKKSARTPMHRDRRLVHVMKSTQGNKVRSDTLKLIFFIHGSPKPNIDVVGWLKQIKIHINHIIYQENYQTIPLYFRALSQLNWD